MTAWAVLVGVLASVTAGQAPTEVAGGTGFADAPTLEAGPSADTITLGGPRWYGVALADGQRLDLTVTVLDRPGDGPGDRGAEPQVQVALYSPLRVAIAPQPATADLVAGGDTTVTARTEVVGDGPAASEAGTWFASVAVLDPAPAPPGEGDGDEPPPDWPLTLDVAVTQTRPATTTELEGLATTTTSEAVATEAASSPGDDGDGVALGPPLGVAVGGLALGVLGGVAVARRRWRRLV